MPNKVQSYKKYGIFSIIAVGKIQEFFITTSQVTGTAFLYMANTPQ